jgi:uroporphyrin-3 C-methyltransferase
MSVDAKNVVRTKAGVPVFTWLIFILLLIITGAAGYGYYQLTLQNAALSQQVTQIQQQAGGETAQIQSLTQSVQQLQQASARDNQDVTTIFQQLNAINDQIDQLQLPPNPLQQETTPAPAEDETGMSWWQKSLNRSMQVLRQIVIVKYNDNKTMPLVLPEEKNFLYHNLHAEVQNAIWALLHHNAVVYQTSLARVTMWVQQYFVQQSPATINILQALAALRTVNVEPQTGNNTGT